MSEIGQRLRAERERLGLSQTVFGELGGVKTNAQSLYEKGERYPDAAYLASVAREGVDVLFVVTGHRTPMDADQLPAELRPAIGYLRSLGDADLITALRLLQALASAAH